MMIGLIANKRFLFASLAMALLTACAGQKTNTVSAELCEDVLISFDTVPINPQTLAESRDFIREIKVLQEAEFTEACSQYPDWRGRFDNAYKRAMVQKIQINESDGIVGIGLSLEASPNKKD